MCITVYGIFLKQTVLLKESTVRVLLTGFKVLEGSNWRTGEEEETRLTQIGRYGIGTDPLQKC